MSFRKAFGLVTCPLLFFTLPRSLGRLAQYSSLLDLVFCSSKNYECDTASIYISLQGWQADVLRQAFGFSSAHCASSAAVNVTRPSSIYVNRLRSFRKAFGLILFSSSPCLLFLTDVYVIGLEMIYMSLQGWQVHVMQDGLSAQYIFLLDLASSFSEGCEFARASISLSLRG